MPIIVPLSFLDKAIAISRKQEGFLQEIPPDSFTCQDVIDRLGSRNIAQAWLKKNAVLLGRFGKRNFYRLKRQEKK